LWDMQRDELLHRLAMPGADAVVAVEAGCVVRAGRVARLVSSTTDRILAEDVTALGQSGDEALLARAGQVTRYQVGDFDIEGEATAVGGFAELVAVGY